MSLQTGIPPSVWAAEGEQMIATMFDLLELRRDAERDAARRGR